MPTPNPPSPEEEVKKSEPEKNTVAELLVEVPLHSPKEINILYVRPQHDDLEWPDEIRDYCSHADCSGVRRHVKRQTSCFPIIGASAAFHYGLYICVDCKVSLKVFGLSSKRIGPIGGYKGRCTKIFQEPNFGPPIPKNIFELIGEENRESFLQARRSIARGLGVGAFAYYRRIIENNKFHLVASFEEAAKKIGAPPEQVAILHAAAKETQFSKAISMLKDIAAIPPVLLINGQNPLLLLHDLLSEGIHQASDSECLERSSEAETILNEIARLMQIAISERKEVNAALTSIMNRKSRGETSA